MGVGMLFRQVINEALGLASYLSRYLHLRQAAAVDPRVAITPYPATAPSPRPPLQLGLATPPLWRARMGTVCKQP